MGNNQNLNFKEKIISPSFEFENKKIIEEEKKEIFINLESLFYYLNKNY